MNTRLNILLVEDNPGDAELIKDMIFESRLKRSDIEEVQTLKHAITQVQNKDFDIILLDLGLPDSAGMDTLYEILKWSESAPVVVFTGLDDEEAGLEAISKGAQDYLVKGKVGSDMLARFILYSIERKKDAKKISHLNSMLKAIRNVNQLIVKEKDVDELIMQSCNILTKEREYLNACIILFDEKNKPYKSSMRRNTKGYDEFRTQVEKGTWKGICQKALGIEGIQIIENPADECGKCPLNECLSGGNAIAIRLEYGDKVYGVMSVRVPRDMAFAKEEQELLKEAAGDISFAIHDIEIEKEHKQAVEKQKISEREKSIILNSSPTLIAYQNMNHEVVWANQAACDSVAKKFDELIGKKCYHIWAKQDEACKGCPVEISWKTKKIVSGEHVTPDGRCWSIIGSPVIDDHGKIIGAVETSLDITERKQAEEQLKKELTEKELLLREIRHRVKNNLQVISGLLHLQQREIKTKEDVAKGFNASQDRILAMAKAYELLLGSEYMSDVSVGKYIESLATQLKNNYDIHNKVKIHYSMDELTVNIEILDRLALALNEIITNAIKYAFEGRDSGTITIQVKGDEDRFTIKISDDGTGIPEEVKTDNPATLGLSIISMIIGQLYGTLSIDRTNGTCFILDIPHKKDEN